MDNITPDPRVGIALPTQHIGLGAINSHLFPISSPDAGVGSSQIDLNLRQLKSPSDFASFEKARIRGIRLSTRGSRQRLLGTRGNDVLDASRGQGRNFLKGNAGNDRMMAGRSDRLLGDAGNDILDANRGRGSNTLLGGAGNDTLYTKTRDAAEGGAGDDILWAGIGGNRLSGGAGADQFWIAKRSLPRSANTIRDFELGVDVIGVNAVPGVTQFSDFALTQQGADTLVSIQGQAIALLSGITASSLTARDFGFQEPTISTSNISVSERDAGVTTIAVEVTLSAASATSVTVNYQTVAGTATAGTDFTPTNGTLTFAPGETTKAIAIDIVGDTIDEFDETFSVVLSNPTNATLTTSQAQVTLIDNDITSITASSTQSDGSKSNNIDASYDFDLYDITAAGDYRRDEDGNLTNTVGIFSGAIENFTGLIREVGVDPFLKFNGLKIGGTTSAIYDLFIPTPLTLDLRATYIAKGGTITFPDGTTAIATSNRIEYRFTNNQLQTEAGLFEWTLIVTNGLFEESIIDPVQAVNSIEYIIANQLLARADQIRFSITSRDNPQELSILTDSIDPINDTDDDTPPPRVVTRTTPPAIPRPIPYNNTVAPTNDAIANATDIGLSSSGFRRFSLGTAIGVIPTDFSEPSSTRDVDLYKVQLNAGEVITIDIDNSFPELDSILRVFNASGTQLAFNNNALAPEEPDDAFNQDSYIQFTAPTTGTYYIGVSGANNTAYNPLIANSGVLGDAGRYNLEIVIREPNNTIATAIDTEFFGFYSTSTRIGDNTGSPNSDIDLYEVQLAAGDVLNIDIDTSAFDAGQRVDSVLRLFNSRGNQLASNNDAPAPGEVASTDSYLSYTATASGTYYIGVSGVGNSFYNPLTGVASGNGSVGFYTLILT